MKIAIIIGVGILLGLGIGLCSFMLLKLVLGMWGTPQPGLAVVTGAVWGIITGIGIVGALEKWGDI